jgi:molybdenum cofactor cytidylyltransferase
MGQPKQLLPYRATTLLGHTALVALSLGASEVVVVLGSRADEVAVALDGLAVKAVVNDHWSEGMGSSIRVGFQALGPVDVGVIMLADQPSVTAEHLRALVERIGNGGCTIAATSYDGIAGPPCAFSRSEFPALLALAGDTGARALIRGGAGEVAMIEFPDAALDVDTEADYEKLVQFPTA